MNTKTAQAIIPGIHLTESELSALRPVAHRWGPRKNMQGQNHAGDLLAKRRGQGMDYLESRQYQYGDDVRHIDWKVTARTNRTHTKIFHEQTNHEYDIFIDQSNSMQFASAGQFKSVIAAKIGCLLAFQAEKQHYQLSCAIQYQAKQAILLRQQKSKTLAQHLIMTLANESLKTTANANPTDIKASLATFAQSARAGSSTFFISDFYTDLRQCEDHIRLLANKTHLTLIHIFDPLEAMLPEKNNLYISNGQQHLQTQTSELSHIYQEAFLEKVAVLKAFCQQYRIKYWQCVTTDDPAQRLAHLLASEPYVCSY